jgi:hypothetical protein
MYKILGYSSGIYRFDEMVEFVEDIGGIVLKRDEFHISRGSYFISQEVHVILVIPVQVFEDLKIFAKELKGDIEELEVKKEQKIDVLSILPVYNVLSYERYWMDIQTLKSKMECPCITGICKESEDSCILNLEKTLDAMLRMDIIENRNKTGVKEYKLKD